MTQDEMLAHYDATRHTRYIQPRPDVYICQECVEMTAPPESAGWAGC